MSWWASSTRESASAESARERRRGGGICAPDLDRLPELAPFQPQSDGGDRFGDRGHRPRRGAPRAFDRALSGPCWRGGQFPRPSPGAVRPILVQHRQCRARHFHPGAVRLSHLSPAGGGRPWRRRPARRDPRADRRLFRRLGRDRHHAPDRHRARHPSAGDGARGHGGADADSHPRDAGDRGAVVDLAHAAHLLDHPHAAHPRIRRGRAHAGSGAGPTPFTTPRKRRARSRSLPARAPARSRWSTSRMCRSPICRATRRGCMSRWSET